MPFERTIRVYADTSVFGGVFDEEFERPSKAFFKAVRMAKFALVTSELVRQEIQAGPKRVQKLFLDILPVADIAEVTAETLKLQQAYIDAGVLSEKHSPDAFACGSGNSFTSFADCELELQGHCEFSEDSYVQCGQHPAWLQGDCHLFTSGGGRI